MRFFFFFLLTISLNAQLSKIHYIPPIASSSGALPNQGQYLYISTPSITEIDVLITPVGGTSQVVTVSNSNPYEYQIQGLHGPGTSQITLEGNNSNQTAYVRDDRGYIIDVYENFISFN